jgi:hypothetical protein
VASLTAGSSNLPTGRASHTELNILHLAIRDRTVSKSGDRADYLPLATLFGAAGCRPIEAPGISKKRKLSRRGEMPMTYAKICSAALFGAALLSSPTLADPAETAKAAGKDASWLFI